VLVGFDLPPEEKMRKHVIGFVYTYFHRPYLNWLLRHEGIELVSIECPLQLNASRCWRLGMIVSELIANA
jgi:hypothetical protein